MAEWCPPTPSPLPDPGQNQQQLLGRDQYSSLCHLGWRPQLITGLIRNLLCAHFSSDDAIEDPNLKTLVWNPGDTTGLVIDSVFRFRPALADKRPALLLKRNAYKNYRVSRGDEAAIDRQGNKEYATLWIGSHTVFAIHGTGNSCEILATEAQRDLTQFAPVVLSDLGRGLKRFQVTDVGDIAEVEESTQNFAIPITVGWAYEETWKLTALQPTLEAISFNLHSQQTGESLT